MNRHTPVASIMIGDVAEQAERTFGKKVPDSWLQGKTSEAFCAASGQGRAQERNCVRTTWGRRKPEFPVCGDRFD